MTDALDPKSALEAAQEAAGVGDYEAAERLLREAAALQEASLGPLHPELASTLNNLALVCERTDKFAEAERGYRRAHAIAVASLAPGHPFIATSLKNLLDFCAARGIPVWTPPAVKPSAETSVPSPEAASPRPRAIVIAAVGMGAFIAVFFIMQWRGANDSSEPAPQVQHTSPSASAAPSSTTPAATNQPQPNAPTREMDRRPTPVAVERPQQARPAPTPTTVIVLNAQLCSALEKRGSPDWQCMPIGVAEPGTLTFYTRLQTDVDTTVEHRWYHGGRLHQRMRLRVRANQSGYRTYSSNTVSSERTGEWTVELRAADETLLREEHFVIR